MQKQFQHPMQKRKSCSNTPCKNTKVVPINSPFKNKNIVSIFKPLYVSTKSNSVKVVNNTSYYLVEKRVICQQLIELASHLQKRVTSRISFAQACQGACTPRHKTHTDSPLQYSTNVEHSQNLAKTLIRRLPQPLYYTLFACSRRFAVNTEKTCTHMDYFMRNKKCLTDPPSRKLGLNTCAQCHPS